DHTLWKDVLVSAGAREIASFRLHLLDRARFPAPRLRSELVFRECGADANGELVRLYRECYAVTGERRDRNPAHTEEYLADVARIGEGREASLWLIGMLGPTSAGLVLVSRSREKPFPGMSAWVLEIGVAPAFRGRGLAGVLMSEALARAG